MHPNAMKSENIVHMAKRNIDQGMEDTAATEERGSSWKLRATERYQKPEALKTCRFGFGRGALAPSAPGSLRS